VYWSAWELVLSFAGATVSVSNNSFKMEGYIGGGLAGKEKKNGTNRLVLYWLGEGGVPFL